MAADITFDESAAERSVPHPLALAWLALFVLLIALGVGITFLGDPHAGDPVVLREIPKVARHLPVHAVKAAAAMQTPAAGSNASVSPAAAASAPQISQKVFVGRALIADPTLIENTPAGPLPRIAVDGTTPMRAYAPAVPADGHPRIALVISGLGISAKATDAALKSLPAAVTLSFAPYESDVQRWVSQARDAGHEVLLEVPMESYDFPDSDLGPHTLRSGAADDTNTQRLIWAMTRFTGYAGVTNLQGGRYLADPVSLEPTLTYLARRGLFFYDNGAAAHSAVLDVAPHAGLSYVQGQSTIDTIQTAMEIDRRLAALEDSAKSGGSAAGTGFLYPVTIDRVARWAQGLSARGFVLVPASAIVTKPK
jgi:polysaccharide deacetylase 2 family uncharacterized protein YibQ